MSDRPCDKCGRDQDTGEFPETCYQCRGAPPPLETDHVIAMLRARVSWLEHPAVVAGNRCLLPLRELEYRIGVHLAEEQAKLAPDTALINILCESLRWAREAEDYQHEAVLNAKIRAIEDMPPIPMLLHCPECSEPHYDEGEWATPARAHRKHLCANCRHLWRPALVNTVGVLELPEEE